MESGVRNLERAIGSVCRIVAYRYAITKEPSTFEKIVIDDTLIKEALGNQKIDNLLHERITKPGVAIGLAWSQVGGAALLVESTKFAGTG
jgi:ATP-dependent Lon protease